LVSLNLSSAYVADFQSVLLFLSPTTSIINPMKKNIWHLGYCLLLFTFTSCFEIKKIDPNKLPPATQRGAETFGCKINGKVWRNYHEFLQRSSVGMEVYTLNGFTFIFFGAHNFLSLEARRIGIRLFSKKLSVGEYFGINTSDSMKVALKRLKSFYGIGVGNDSTNYTVVDGFIERGDDYYLRTDLPGSLNITYVDTLRRIVSGEFYFTAGKPNSQLYEVTEGRFDLKYNLTELK
jgi:hypothetical protein